MPDREELSLPAAAMRLRLSYHAAYALLLTGRLVGRSVNGRWKVTAESVREELERREQHELHQTAV